MSHYKYVARGSPPQPADDLDTPAAQRRDAIATQARLDADRWLDDGGSVRDETVPLPRPKSIR